MRRIERRAEVEAQVGHTMERQRVHLRVEVCGPSTGRTDGKPSRELWADEPIVVITAADDEAWERLAEVEDITLPLSQLLAALTAT